MYIDIKSLKEKGREFVAKYLKLNGKLLKMPKLGKDKNDRKYKKDRKDTKKLLQAQTNMLLNMKTRSPSVSSIESSQTVYQLKIGNESESDRLRSQMLILQNKIDELDAQNSQKNSVENDDGPNENDGAAANVIVSQLYGKDYKEEDMVLLKNEIYCRKNILEMAKGSAFKSSHVARRLLDGVFKKETLLNCTLSGQSPKSQGEERRARKYECLNSHAKEAIIEFSIERGEEKGWAPQNRYEINRAMTQKIGELKRHYKRNL